MRLEKSLIKPADKATTVHIDGHCMAPVLHHGQAVKMADFRLLIPGDIIVYHDRSGRLTSHRLIGQIWRRQASGWHWCYLTQADNGLKPDPWIEKQQIIGKLSLSIPIPTRLWSTGRFVHYMLKAALRRLILKNR